MDWKKLIWRAVRGSVYAAVGLVLSKYVGPYLFLDDATLTAIATGILMAIDKLLGVGALVKSA